MTKTNWPTLCPNCGRETKTIGDKVVCRKCGHGQPEGQRKAKARFIT